MTNLEIIQLVCLALITIAFTVLTVAKGIKNKWISKLMDCIKESIKEAEEQWPEGHGSDKTAHVLEKVKEKCDELGIPYKMVYKLVKSLIDKIVANYNVIAK